MLLFQNPINIALLFIVCALHVSNTFFDGIYVKIGQIVNIILHIVLFCVLLLNNLPIEEMVLAYMISVFLLLLSGYIKWQVNARQADSVGSSAPDGEEEGDGNV